MRKLTKAAFLALFDPEVHPKLIETAEKYPDAIGFVVFENLQMDSSQCGTRSAVIVGPSNTFKSVEGCMGLHLNDLRSQRQYPTLWIPREDVLR